MKSHKNEKLETGVQAIDPVCGMQVSENGQHRHVHKGTQYLFCSGSCHDKFVSTPEKYLSPVENTTEDKSEASLYTCPMHPEIQQTGPGACPKCGMALEPAGIPVAVSKTEYTCPMHPEIIQDHPGSCPKCGMALEPRSVEAEEDTSELDYMSRRFWVSTMLALPVFFSAMAAEFWPEAIAAIIKVLIKVE